MQVLISTCSDPGCDRPLKAKGLCDYHYKREWAKTNPDRIRNYGRKYREANPDAAAAARRKWYEANREGACAASRVYKFAVAYGMTQEAAAAVLAAKPSACEVCGRGDLAICFDHCHTTGAHRGWLCTRCNTALGYVLDDPATLRALADYLERS